jgi:hypothetical protein
MPVDSIHEPRNVHLTKFQEQHSKNLQHTAFHPISKSGRRRFLMEVIVFAIHFSTVKTTTWEKNYISSEWTHSKLLYSGSNLPGPFDPMGLNPSCVVNKIFWP